MASDLIAYLGPEGSFTHEAALTWVGDGGAQPYAVAQVQEVIGGVATGRWRCGVIAIESSVEGYVVPALDALIESADVVAVDQTDIAISFDAFTLADDSSEPRYVSAHPHGLAQCQSFIASLGVPTKPATSNAAACRDLIPGGVALGPQLCGSLYGLRTLATNVADFRDARTRFLLVTGRDEARQTWDTAADSRKGGAVSRVAQRAAHPNADGGWSTMVALTPLRTGPGVLARIADGFGARGVNMSSVVTRPIKALQGRYVFVITCDSAPWEPSLHGLFTDLLAAGDSIKTLGVFPSVEDYDAHVDPRRVPIGSVSQGSDTAHRSRGLLWD